MTETHPTTRLDMVVLGVFFVTIGGVILWMLISNPFAPRLPDPALEALSSEIRSGESYTIRAFQAIPYLEYVTDYGSAPEEAYCVIVDPPVKTVGAQDPWRYFMVGRFGGSWTASTVYRQNYWTQAGCTGWN